jgi:hypothetical protein
MQVAYKFRGAANPITTRLVSKERFFDAAMSCGTHASIQSTSQLFDSCGLFDLPDQYGMDFIFEFERRSETFLNGLSDSHSVPTVLAI